MSLIECIGINLLSSDVSVEKSWSLLGIVTQKITKQSWVVERWRFNYQHKIDCFDS
jgi:hypothetical protein